MKFAVLLFLSLTLAHAADHSQNTAKLENLNPDSVAVSKEVIQINKTFIRDIASDKEEAKKGKNGEIPFWFTSEEK